jgi:hypothetical protein
MVLALNFDQLSQSGLVTYLAGINPDQFNDYAKLILDNLDVDTDIRKNVDEFMRDVPFIDINVWHQYKVLFSNNGVSKASYLAIMAYKSDDGKLRVYSARFKTDFVLGPDMIISEVKKSSHYGLVKTKS